MWISADSEHQFLAWATNVSWRARKRPRIVSIWPRNFDFTAVFRISAMHSRNIDGDIERNEIICSPNTHHLSRSAYPPTFLGSIRSSCSAKKVIRINRCFLYARCALSFSLSGTFIFMIDNDPVRAIASHSASTRTSPLDTCIISRSLITRDLLFFR